MLGQVIVLVVLGRLLWLLFRPSARPKRIVMSPDEFVAVIGELPRTTLVIEENWFWAAGFTYTYSAGSHLLVAESPTPLQIPAIVVRASDSRRWMPQW